MANSGQLENKPTSFLPQLVFSEASLSAVKWLALILMVVDHINKYAYEGSVDWMYAVGRLSMPLFGFVLGYNLSRPGLLASDGYKRIALRLILCGAVATVPFVVLNKLVDGWWPLNMMFSFLVATLVAWLLDKGNAKSIVFACLFLIWGGVLVEFWWPGVVLVLCVWSYRRTPSLICVVGFVACLGLFYVVNSDFSALMVLPLLAVLRWWQISLPRSQIFFYAFYPGHLFLFWSYLLVTGGSLQGLSF